MSNPKVSVLMTNFNHARYLPQAIEGVLSQRMGDFEFLIHDDGSTDESRDVIERYCATDQRVHLIASAENVGTLKGAERLLSAAKGDVFAFQGADDFLSDTGMFGDLLQCLKMFPSAGAAYGKSIEIHGDSNDEDLWPYGHAHRPGLVAGAEFAEAYFKGLLMPNTFACLWRRTDFNFAGGFLPDLGMASDICAIVLIGVRSGLVYVDKVYSRMRIRKGRNTDSERVLDAVRHYAEIERRVQEALPDFLIPVEWRRIYRARMINYKLRPEWQDAFIAETRAHFEKLDYWREFYLPKAYSAFKRNALEQCELLVAELSAARQRAEAVFQDVAGPL